jgi:hypothetical protein
MTINTTTRLDKSGGAPYGTAIVLHGKVTVAAGENLDADNGDILNLIHVPAGTEMHTLTVINGDLDSGANLTAKIGFAYVDGVDSTVVPQDDDIFLASAAWGQAAATTTYYMDPPLIVQKDAYITITVTSTTAAANAGAVAVKGTLLGAVVGIN